MLFFALTGCGSGYTSNPTGPITYPDLTGNWQIQTSTNTDPGLLMVGAMAQSGQNVTGTFRFIDLDPGNSCGTAFQLVSLAGTIDPTNGLLTLQSQSSPSGQLSIAAYMYINPAQHEVNDGKILVAGPCPTPYTVLVGFQLAPLTGTYSGTLSLPNTLLNLGNGTGTLKVSQSATPTADGQFPINGTVLFQSPACNATVAVTGTVSGNQVNLSSPPDTTGVSQVMVTGSESADGATLSDTEVLFQSGQCAASLSNYSSFGGTLTLQK